MIALNINADWGRWAKLYQWILRNFPFHSSPENCPRTHTPTGEATFKKPFPRPHKLSYFLLSPALPCFGLFFCFVDVPILFRFIFFINFSLNFIFLLPISPDAPDVISIYLPPYPLGSREREYDCLVAKCLILFLVIKIQLKEKRVKTEKISACWVWKWISSFSPRSLM